MKTKPILDTSDRKLWLYNPAPGAQATVSADDGWIPGSTCLVLIEEPAKEPIR
jgi:hypothetical protein